MSKEYNRYLGEHFNYVFAAACWMADRLDTVKELGSDVIDAAFENIHRHDMSKYTPEEYDPYDSYFYGERDEDAFNRAWLHHIHNNPHHWQHWVLITDDEGVFALEMPKECVIEMVADWWSFSWRSSNLQEVFGWYGEHRSVMTLHPKTRALVEAMLDELREKLALMDESEVER